MRYQTSWVSLAASHRINFPRQTPTSGFQNKKIKKISHFFRLKKKLESDLATGATWVDERRQQQRLSHREVFSFVSGTTPLPGPLTPAPTPANPAAPRPIFGLETFEVRAAPIRQKMRFSSSLFYFLCDFLVLSLSLSLPFFFFLSLP